MAALSWAVESRSPRGTRGLARRLGETLRPGAVLALAGDLGAGKTAFVQGLAEGLGIHEPVLSPTFALMNVYPDGRWPLVHLDLYRLDDPEAVRALGLDEQLSRPDAVVAVEWADKHRELFGEGCIWVELAWQGPQARRITVRGIEKPKRIRLVAS
jgi:tRNA threonylcarbamoyladenosine biosynthesis protein TsaE